MSLLEKARGSRPSGSPAPTSLFSRASAAHEAFPKGPAPIQTELDTSGLESLEKRLASLPRCHDSILAAWSLISESLALSATALFLPQGDFLAPAALGGFPSGTLDVMPMSFARASQVGVELLGNEAKALLAPILGIPLTLSLRAATMHSDSDFLGLWVYHDPSLDASSRETQAKIGSLLGRAGAGSPLLQLVPPQPVPVRALIEASRKYPVVSVYSFDLATFLAVEQPRFRGLQFVAIRSAFLASCLRMLSKGGTAIAYGEHSVACVLGSASPIDPGLALFQFDKTLRRILPFLAASSFPEGRAMSFDPSADSAMGNLESFLSQ